MERTDRRARLAALGVVLLLHVGLWFQLASSRPVEPAAIPARVLTTSLQPAPPPPVPPVPALPIHPQPPPGSTSLVPNLDLRALLPPVRRPDRDRQAVSVAGSSERLPPVTGLAPAAASSPGRGRGDGAGRQPCLPCVWTWEQRLVARIQDVILSPRLPRQTEASVRVRLVMTRSGTLLRAELLDISPSARLNREAVDAAWRASPLPSAPIDVEGDPVELVVPIRFFAGQR